MFISSQFVLPRVWAQFGSVLCESVTKMLVRVDFSSGVSTGESNASKIIQIVGRCYFPTSENQEFMVTSKPVIDYQQDKVLYTMRSSQQLCNIVYKQITTPIFTQGNTVIEKKRIRESLSTTLIVRTHPPQEETEKIDVFLPQPMNYHFS